MSAEQPEPPSRIRSRREPPPLRPVTVVDRAEVTPRLLRLTFEGAGLTELVAPEPAASVRLLVPSPGTAQLIMPEWNGNEFLLPDGSRPALRTFTPLRFDPAAGRLDLEIVRHPGGAVSDWAEGATVGDPAAISGPGRGLELPADATRLLVLGDETALPAITQLLEVVPRSVVIEAHVEVAEPLASTSVQTREGATLTWHVNTDTQPGATLVAVAMMVGALAPTDHVWAAGEAASMQAIRKHLFDEVGVPRRQTTIRGYWKPRRA